MGEREPNVLLEGFFFTVVAIAANGFMQWQMPNADTVWALQWGLVWAWAALMMFVVDRFGSNLGIRLVVAAVAGGGYFWLEQNGCGLAAGLFGGDKLVVLGAHHDGVDAQGATVVIILHRNLALGVGAQIGHHLSFATNVGQYN